MNLTYSPKLTPDGYRYLWMGKGNRGPSPFHLRWLLPLLCGNNLYRWIGVTWASIILLPVLVGAYVYMHSYDLTMGLLAGALTVGLPLLRFWFRSPVVTEPFGLCCALGAALLPQPYGLLLAGLGSCARESVPIFAAVYTMDPLYLLGMLPVLVRWAYAQTGKDILDEENWWILANPLAASLKYHAGKWLSPRYMLAPWGMLLAALVVPTTQLWIALALAYGQLLVATDTGRLYIWALPVMALGATDLLAPVAILAVIVHFFHPWNQMENAI